MPTAASASAIGKRAEQKSGQARRRERGGDHVVHRPHVGDRQARIHLPDLVANGARHAQRIAGRARDHEHAANRVAAGGGDGPLDVGNEELLLDDPGHAVVPLVGDDADNRRPRTRLAAETNAAADDDRGSVQ